MSSGDGIGVTPSDLIAHAGHVEAIGDRVATARQAGAAVRPSMTAYGKLCTIVPTLLAGLQDMVVDGIDAAAHSLHDSGQRLRTAADGYQSADDHAQARHQRVRGPQ
ncbi:type VII secretion target [Planosporangium mesophilum]|uniref:ESX-1 secretion-associated protein n=1 Tax=Planosporangium mesophilum TaxID=689768 RepID=A0A8J3X2P5_9ACTN|nr:type VII secretion target [Planosporangium mesophilum]NJC86192.1 ESX-1 secretion-associated protein [Planosporangium mesophilum]GII25717.1 hypothetical protein Pme01_53140 [Planosporangium mesophilum]